MHKQESVTFNCGRPTRPFLPSPGPIQAHAHSPQTRLGLQLPAPCLSQLPSEIQSQPATLALAAAAARQWRRHRGGAAKAGGRRGRALAPRRCNRVGANACCCSLLPCSAPWRAAARCSAGHLCSSAGTRRAGGHSASREGAAGGEATTSGAAYQLLGTQM